MKNTKIQIDTIQKLFQETQKQEIPIWLESGWAIDARLGRITREHADIDIAFASGKRSAYKKILEDLGFGNHEKLDYGFLMRKGEIVIDSEPCCFKSGSYTLEGFPPGFIIRLDKIEGWSTTDIDLPGAQLPIGRTYKSQVMNILEKKSNIL